MNSEKILLMNLLRTLDYNRILKLIIEESIKVGWSLTTDRLSGEFYREKTGKNLEEITITADAIRTNISCVAN